MREVRGRDRLIFGVAVVVVAAITGVVVYFGVFRTTAPASQPVAATPSAVVPPPLSATTTPAPSGRPSPGQIEASLGLPTTDEAGDVLPAATPGLAGGTLIETTARVFAARFSVYAPYDNTSAAQWAASWKPIASPSLGNGAGELVSIHLSFTWDQGVKATNPRVKSAVRVWSGLQPDGRQQMWRVTLVRTLVAIDGTTKSDTEQTVGWDIEVSETAKPLVTAVWPADPRRTAPPRED